MIPKLERFLSELPRSTKKCVEHFWSTRENARKKQQESGRPDVGQRGAVTGGGQMDAFVSLIADAARLCGVPDSDIHCRKALELPGYYRPTKKWDLLIVSQGRLMVALEAKSHVGPSFGNNFNNRAEEAIGSAVDIWTAFREGKFNGAHAPWLGYLMLLEDSAGSQCDVRAKEPHFEVFEEFKTASYSKRYEILCRRLRLERLYSQAAFLLSRKDNLSYTEPASELRVEVLVRSMIGHLLGELDAKQ